MTTLSLSSPAATHTPATALSPLPVFVAPVSPSLHPASAPFPPLSEWETRCGLCTEAAIGAAPWLSKPKSSRSNHSAWSTMTAAWNVSLTTTASAIAIPTTSCLRCGWKTFLLPANSRPPPPPAPPPTLLFPANLKRQNPAGSSTCAQPANSTGKPSTSLNPTPTMPANVSAVLRDPQTKPHAPSIFAHQSPTLRPAAPPPINSLHLPLSLALRLRPTSPSPLPLPVSRNHHSPTTSPNPPSCTSPRPCLLSASKPRPPPLQPTSLIPPPCPTHRQVSVPETTTTHPNHDIWSALTLPPRPRPRRSRRRPSPRVRPLTHIPPLELVLTPLAPFSDTPTRTLLSSALVHQAATLRTAMPSPLNSPLKPF